MKRVLLTLAAGALATAPLIALASTAHATAPTPPTLTVRCDAGQGYLDIGVLSAGTYNLWIDSTEVRVGFTADISQGPLANGDYAVEIDLLDFGVVFNPSPKVTVDCPAVDTTPTDAPTGTDAPTSTGAQGSGGSIPATGSDSGGLLVLGGGLVVIGGTLVATRRLRKV